MPEVGPWTPLFDARPANRIAYEMLSDLSAYIARSAYWQGFEIVEGTVRMQVDADPRSPDGLTLSVRVSVRPK